MSIKRRVEKLEGKKPAAEEPIIIKVVYHGPDEPAEDADVIRILELLPNGQVKTLDGPEK